MSDLPRFLDETLFLFHVQAKRNWKWVYLFYLKSLLACSFRNKFEKHLQVKYYRCIWGWVSDIIRKSVSLWPWCMMLGKKGDSTCTPVTFLSLTASLCVSPLCADAEVGCDLLGSPGPGWCRWVSRWRKVWRRPNLLQRPSQWLWMLPVWSGRSGCTGCKFRIIFCLSWRKLITIILPAVTEKLL